MSNLISIGRNLWMRLVTMAQAGRGVYRCSRVAGVGRLQALLIGLKFGLLFYWGAAIYDIRWLSGSSGVGEFLYRVSFTFRSWCLTGG